MADFDEDLIRALQVDGRAQFSGIAARLGVHRAVVAERVHELLASGELRIIAAVHPRVLGLPVQAHLMLQISGPTVPVFERLAAHDNVVYLSEVTGASQAVVEIWAGSREDLARCVAAIHSLPGVIDVQLTLYDRVVRTLLLGAEPDVRGLSLDSFDIALMAQLQQDGRLTYGELAERTGRSTSACRVRVLRLLDARVMQIGGVRARRRATSAVLFGAGIMVDGEAQEVECALLRIPGIEFVAHTIGRFSLLATIATRSMAEYTEVVRVLRATPGVRFVETWIHAAVWLERYQWRLDRLERLRRG